MVHLAIFWDTLLYLFNNPSWQGAYQRQVPIVTSPGKVLRTGILNDPFTLLN